MNEVMITLMGTLGGVVVGGITSYILVSKKREREDKILLEEAKRERDRILSEARKEADRIISLAKEREEQVRKEEREVLELERKVLRESERVKEQGERLKRLEEELKDLKAKALLELERIAGMSKEEAKEELLKKVEEESKEEAERIMRRIEEEAKRSAEEKAKWVILTAVQRISPQIAVNYTTTSVELPSDDYKGRIIGREGRNIKTFEQITGVDLIIDDTPNMVTISSFDPYRREIAKEALERLIEDGRIHPARIEEVVEEVKREFDEKVRKLGEETVFELGLSREINPKLYYYIGKLYYRTSYSQNVLMHSKEVATISALLAEELGLDVKKAKRAGLLHDIGKAVSHELGGSHTDVGVELCRRFGEPDYVINAIKAHHEEEPVKYPEVALVCAADALSAARPGARRETLEKYLRRLEKIEEIVKSFKGIANAYAVQAGREVRVLVNPEEISDSEAHRLAREIASRIERELDFPGQIKVVVIRETRHVEYAK